MTDVQIDILEIKQILAEMQKNIEKIEKELKNAYFEDKIIDYYAVLKQIKK